MSAYLRVARLSRNPKFAKRYGRPLCGAARTTSPPGRKAALRHGRQCRPKNTLLRLWCRILQLAERPQNGGVPVRGERLTRQRSTSEHKVNVARTPLGKIFCETAGNGGEHALFVCRHRPIVRTFPHACAGGSRMKRPGIFRGMIIAAVGVACTLDAWAADVMPTEAAWGKAASLAEPVACPNFWDFIATKCQLTWQGHHDLRCH